MLEKNPEAKNMNGPTSEQEKIIWQAVTSLCLLFIVALGLMIFVLFLQGLLFLSSVLVPLAIAAVIAYLLHPVICWLERRGMKRTPAIILLFISTTVTLAIISAILVPKLYTETSGLIRDLPQMKDSLLEKSRSWLDANPDIAAQVPKIEEHLQAELPKYNAQIASWVWTGVGGFFSTLGLLLGLVFIPLYVFYLLRDQPSIESSWHDYVPLQRSSINT